MKQVPGVRLQPRYTRRRSRFSQIKQNVAEALSEAVPGKRLLGNYRFLPLFFLAGAAIEFAMIHWVAGTKKINFCEKNAFYLWRNGTKRRFSSCFRRRDQEEEGDRRRRLRGVPGEGLRTAENSVLVMRGKILFGLASLASLFLGSQAVHAVFQPLSDFDEYVQRERDKRKEAAASERASETASNQADKV